MSTLATLKTELARAVRDTGNDTFDADELADVLNQGLAQLSRFFPREVVDSSIALVVSVNSYTTSAAFTHIYRVDRYSAAAVWQETLPVNTGDGPDSGWEWHASLLWLPPSRTWTTGDTLKVFGYAGYAQLVTDDDEPPLEASGEWALILFGQVELYGRLTENRVAFQQWQANPMNTDVSALSLANIYASAQNRWEEEKRSLRRMRKSG